MDKHIIRTAVPADQDVLTELKTAYIRGLFRGFLPAEHLKGLDPTPYRSELGECLANPALQILICMEEDTPQGYLTIGTDPEDPSCGMIFDAAANLDADPAVRDTLIVTAAERLAARGNSRIHIWLLRDNFRVRFLFEQFNFKAEGTLRPYQVEGREVQLIRYVYRIPTL